MEMIKTRRLPINYGDQLRKYFHFHYSPCTWLFFYFLAHEMNSERDKKKTDTTNFMLITRDHRSYWLLKLFLSVDHTSGMNNWRLYLLSLHALFTMQFRKIIKEKKKNKATTKMICLVIRVHLNHRKD